MDKGKEDLNELLDRAKTVTMTDEEKEEQRRDFAYGNTRLSNPAITREMVDEVADKMATRDDELRRQVGEPKPYLVQRLLARAEPFLEADSIFRFYAADHMGAGEFEHGILEEALIQACKVCKPEKWFVRAIYVGPDITVHYVGPEHRFESACKFLQTQLIQDGSERYMAERPLKETTHLRSAYLCLEPWCARYCGWWRLDIDHQFFFFKTDADAKRCLSVLQTTNWKAFLT